MPVGMMYSVVFLFLDVPIVRDTARNFQYHSSVGLMGHCVMLMEVDSVPRLWGRKREEGGSPQGELRQCVAGRAVESGEWRL